MGYTTDFSGEFRFDHPLTEEQAAYINLFSSTRRMKRNPEVLAILYLGWHGLLGSSNYGIDGEYFAMDDGESGQRRDESIVDFNTPPRTQPGLWCQWAVNEERTALEWDGGEKFYNYVAWLEYLIKNFFEPWGVKLSGEIKWQGEDMDDRGLITCEASRIHVRELE